MTRCDRSIGIKKITKASLFCFQLFGKTNQRGVPFSMGIHKVHHSKLFYLPSPPLCLVPALKYSAPLNLSKMSSGLPDGKLPGVAMPACVWKGRRWDRAPEGDDCPFERSPPSNGGAGRLCGGRQGAAAPADALLCVPDAVQPRAHMRPLRAQVARRGGAALGPHFFFASGKRACPPPPCLFPSPKQRCGPEIPGIDGVHNAAGPRKRAGHGDADVARGPKRPRLDAVSDGTRRPGDLIAPYIGDRAGRAGLTSQGGTGVQKPTPS
jgi:hypothetical protein